jgi:hypothetical protein
MRAGIRGRSRLSRRAGVEVPDDLFRAGQNFPDIFLHAATATRTTPNISAEQIAISRYRATEFMIRKPASDEVIEVSRWKIGEPPSEAIDRKSVV